jgi:hypothetical protein
MSILMSVESCNQRDSLSSFYDCKYSIDWPSLKRVNIATSSSSSPQLPSVENSSNLQSTLVNPSPQPSPQPSSSSSSKRRRNDPSPSPADELRTESEEPTHSPANVLPNVQPRTEDDTNVSSLNPKDATGKHDNLIQLADRSVDEIFQQPVNTPPN